LRWRTDRNLAIFGFYSQRGAIGLSPQVPMAWMVGRDAAGTLTIAALVVERRVPHSRQPERK